MSVQTIRCDLTAKLSCFNTQFKAMHNATCCTDLRVEPVWSSQARCHCPQIGLAGLSKCWKPNCRMIMTWTCENLLTTCFCQSSKETVLGEKKVTCETGWCTWLSRKTPGSRLALNNASTSLHSLCHDTQAQSIGPKKKVSTHAHIIECNLDYNCKHIVFSFGFDHVVSRVIGVVMQRRGLIRSQPQADSNSRNPLHMKPRYKLTWQTNHPKTKTSET